MCFHDGNEENEKGHLLSYYYQKEINKGGDREGVTWWKGRYFKGMCKKVEPPCRSVGWMLWKAQGSGAAGWLVAGCCWVSAVELVDEEFCATTVDRRNEASLPHNSLRSSDTGSIVVDDEDDDDDDDGCCVAQ